MGKNKSLILFFLVIATIASCHFQSDKASKHHDNLQSLSCYASFESFSRGETRLNPNIPHFTREEFLPDGLWHLQSTFPDYTGANRDYSWEVQLVRTSDESYSGYTEVWISGISGGSRAKEIAIYLKELDQWKFVPKKIAGEKAFVQDIYLLSNGTIWARNIWEPTELGSSSLVPMLSRYNEEKQMFELVASSVVAPISLSTTNRETHTTLDSDDNFWLAVDGYALYKYETEPNQLTKIVDLPLMFIVSIVAGPNGNVYFANKDADKIYNLDLMALHPGSLMRFSSKKNEIEEVTLPDLQWPLHGLRLEIENNRLWIDSIGYLNLEDESWHLLFSDLSKHFELDFWQSPYLLLKDSYDTYWFQLTGDEASSGTAWYDLKTGNGCMFTNMSVDVVEDNHQVLWLFASGSKGNLYSLARK